MGLRHQPQRDAAARLTSDAAALRTSETLSKQARGWQRRGRYAQAQRLAARALVVLERARATPAIRQARIRALDHLGTLERIQGRYDRAEALFRDALARAIRLCGPQSLEVSIVLNNLAVVHKYQGRFPEGRRLYQRSSTRAGATRAPSPSRGAPSRSGNRRSAPTTWMSPTTWRRSPQSSMGWGATSRPRRCTGARSPSSSGTVRAATSPARWATLRPAIT
jgi:tetratricopeptide repeat protein